MEKENNKQSVVDKREEAIVRFAENTETNLIYARVVYFLTYLFVVPLILACYTIFSVIMPVSFKQFGVLILSVGLVFLFVGLHEKFYPKSSIVNVMLFFLLFLLILKAFVPILLAFIATF